MGQFDYSDLAKTALDFDLRNAKNPIFMLATIRCVYPNATKHLKLQPLDKINGKC